MYFNRLIDKSLEEWAKIDDHKPILLRGARQVGKSSSVKHLGRKFKNYAEINFEKTPIYKDVFEIDLDPVRIVSQLSALCGTTIVPGKTLLFLDEIQECPKAVMSLRFFREELPQLHVIAAGSLLEFALDDLPTFGVGRIHSVFMRPMSFDEFEMACGFDALLKAKNEASAEHPLPEPLYKTILEHYRTYMMVGGMPEVVLKWVKTHDYIQCQEVQDDIIVSYEDDFPKYKNKVNPDLLRAVMRSAAIQCGRKFVYANVAGYKTHAVKQALDLLYRAGILVPVTHTSANGLPLGGEADSAKRKVIFLDCGLLLRTLNMALGDITEITTRIITASAADLVNKGAIAEQVAGTELLVYKSANLRHELYYWAREAKNSLAEVDYVESLGNAVTPIEVKANVQGGMKSLWVFMREKKLHRAVRCSAENFGTIIFVDSKDGDEQREVEIVPLFAISKLYR
ncbi:MAG: AAA family ATPase [Bacteroidales bacterium]|nr:AAA family ATPase [Bacteroidales bacterium]